MRGIQRSLVRGTACEHRPVGRAEVSGPSGTVPHATHPLRVNPIASARPASPTLALRQVDETSRSQTHPEPRPRLHGNQTWTCGGSRPGRRKMIYQGAARRESVQAEAERVTQTDLRTAPASRDPACGLVQTTNGTRSRVDHSHPDCARESWCTNLRRKWCHNTAWLGPRTFDVPNGESYLLQTIACRPSRPCDPLGDSFFIGALAAPSKIIHAVQRAWAK